MQQVEGGAPPAPADLVNQLTTQPFNEELQNSSTQVTQGDLYYYSMQ